MFHSIRFKFFAASCAIAVAFVGILSVLNLTLYDHYYLWQRQRALRSIAETVHMAYSGSSSEALTQAILYAEDTEGVRLSIVGGDGAVRYDSVMREQLTGSSGLSGSLFHGLSIAENALRSVDLAQVQQQGTVFVSVLDERRGEEFLCLVGRLAPEDDYLVARIPFTYMQQNSSFNMVFLLISGGATLLVCIFLAFFISRRFTRPLIAIGDVANAMADLNFSKTYEGPVQDEIGRLGLSVNRLSAHLEQTIDQLRASNIRLAQEIDEKERIDAMRREFIINVSHELKTPIALIQGYAEGLREGIAETPADRAYYCTTICDEAARMNRMVMQLLSLSKLELGREMPQLAPAAVDELLADAVLQTALLAQERGLTVNREACGLTVHTDYAMLLQAVQNYLTNAIRYTHEGGSITLCAAQRAGFVRITVINEGEGVDEAELPRLWDKFYRTDKARARTSGGTGVGLSIVRATAEVLGGACGCRNVPQGMAFWFDVPDNG